MAWESAGFSTRLANLISLSDNYATMRNTPPFPSPFICLILLGLCRLVVSGECLASQQSLLLQLKDSLSFYSDYSTKLVNWNESFDCCSWKGVTCEEGRVTQLDLSGERIDGGLENSSVLFGLQHLKSLDLSFNNFNSTIPSRIGSLTNLSHLDLAYAGFRGQVPIDISRLRSLVTLDLSSLEIPNLSILVQNLSKLEEIYLDGANISTPGNRWCQALSSSSPNLRVLSLRDGYVPGPLDQSLVELQSLAVVDLEGTKLASPVPKSFAKFSNLTSLNLYACGLQGIFPNEIFQVPTLQIIDLSFNEFLEGALPEFQIDNSLQELSLSSTKFGGRLPTSLGNLWNLSSLHLSMCQFNGRLPSSMSNLTQLVDVDLSSNNFTGLVPPFNFSTKLSTLDLSNNSLGELPLSLFANPSLEAILLDHNQFSGSILEFETKSSSLLRLDLSHNNLEGIIPTSIFKLGNLTSLDLSYNKFNGTKHQKIFQGYNNLLTLDLSCNNLKYFPDLKNLPELQELNLSYNHISEKQPKYFFLPSSLQTVDLHSNQLQGNIPILPQSLEYLDLSSNNFTSIQYNNFNNLSRISLFSLSKNNLTGVIPESICGIEHLFALDLSYNNLHGRIPSCLIETSNSPDTLNLRKNNLEGPIPDVFPRGCTLEALILDGNFIDGAIPKSLANCNALEVLDLGNNDLMGEFPCFLMNTSALQVLILQSNKFYGSIECPNANDSRPVLQIFDVAHNNLCGQLPRRWLTKLQKMKVDEDNIYSGVLGSTGGYGKSVYGGYGKSVYLTRCSIDPQHACYVSTDRHCENVYDRRCSRGSAYANSGHQYTYTVTVTFKGLVMELQKILDIFTSIDLSRNNFHGQMPPELGELHALYILNLSHNALTGQIPSSIGSLQKLESLDLSWNNLNGTIPMQLQSLNFLQVLNLSFNQLVGMIPIGSQIQTFPEDSFIGNKGLYGCPLKRNCSYKEAFGALIPNATKDSHSNSKRKIDWSLLSVEFGLLTGFGLVVSPLVFSRRWRLWYYERVDDIIFKVFPLAVSRKWFLWTAM